MSDSQQAVLVTGGSRGLGLGIVRSLLASGYKVGTCSRTMSPELESMLQDLPEQLFWKACEIGNEQAEQALFDDFIEWCGDSGLYGLVNNAGIAGEGILATFPNLDSERIIQVNLLASLRLCRLASRVLLKQNNGGRIVNISSIIGIRGYTGLGAYSASKAGLDGLSRSLARELGRRRITVNSVNPGYLETDMSASLQPAKQNQIVRRTPLGRLGAVKDVTPVIEFLLSDSAAFITGQCIVVDGGISC